MTDDPSLSPCPDLAAASPEEITEVLFYARRFDERGKPRRSGWDFAAKMAAESLTAHLRAQALS